MFPHKGPFSDFLDRALLPDVRSINPDEFGVGPASSRLCTCLQPRTRTSSPSSSSALAGSLRVRCAGH